LKCLSILLKRSLDALQALADMILLRKIIDDKSVKFFTNTLLLHPKKQEIKLKNCEYKEGQLYMKTSYEMILFADKKVKESINVFYHRTDISFWIYI
jgi:hypothetical protein